jgi:hypothetical protein
MWNTTTRSQGTSGVAPTRASTKAIWELPVANMAWATPRASTAERSTVAASSAAARAMVAVVPDTRTSAPPAPSPAPDPGLRASGPWGATMAAL